MQTFNGDVFVLKLKSILEVVFLNFTSNSAIPFEVKNFLPDVMQLHAVIKY